MNLWPVEHFYNIFAIIFSNHTQKWGQICYKSVQLVRGLSFWNDFLQNPYFNRKDMTYSEKCTYCSIMIQVDHFQNHLFFNQLCNPQYDKWLFIELRVEDMKIPSSEHFENVLCTQIVFCFCFDLQNNLCKYTACS